MRRLEAKDSKGGGASLILIRGPRRPEVRSMWLPIWTFRLPRLKALVMDCGDLLQKSLQSPPSPSQVGSARLASITHPSAGSRNSKLLRSLAAQVAHEPYAAASRSYRSAIGDNPADAPAAARHVNVKRTAGHAVEDIVIGIESQSGDGGEDSPRPAPLLDLPTRVPSRCAGGGAAPGPARSRSARRRGGRRRTRGGRRRERTPSTPGPTGF